MTTIAVVDYGAGNLVSIDQALAAAGAKTVRLRAAGSVDADGLVVPGVGSAGSAMARLARRGLDTTIRSWIAAGRPYLGICLGLQLLFESSEEDGARLLGLLPGRVVRLASAPRLPHIGWNQVALRARHPLFAGIGDATDFYFVHSYAVGAGTGVLGVTEYGAPFVSAVAAGPVTGVQFHPERSGRDGLRLLANFVGIAARASGSSATHPGEEVARCFASG